jgi:hypothetical protein
MTANRLIVESAVKAALKRTSGLKVISAEAMDFVNLQAAAAVDDCAARGRRTPGGRLMAPDGKRTVVAGVVVCPVLQDPDSDGRARPERLCARAKEFAALSLEQKAEHLHKLYVLTPAINKEAIDLLKDIVSESRNLEDAIIMRAGDIIKYAEELQP